MRIAIDARLNAYRQGGISQYTRQLLMALPDVARDDEFVSLQHRDQLRPLAIAPNVVRRTALTPPHHRFEQWTLPLEVLLARPHVLHCPDFIAPVRRPCPAVVTIHDLAFMHYPEILDDAARAYYGQVKTNAPRADGIIAVSEATRQDIAQFLDIPIDQIDVIYEAAAPLYQPIPLREGEARVLNSTPVEAGSFLLFVSTLEPRKNLPTLLRALRICIDRRPDAGYKLVVVGRRGWRDEAIFTTARELGLGEHVLFAGGVGQYDLRWLYNACRLYINPSLYEGFGLPLLEAMACGAPCLAAATSSLPEIGGNAAIYVPPLDAEVWADEIEALWDDESRRAELSRMGLARARQFSWARAARETLAVYRRAAERRPLEAVAPSPANARLFNADTAEPIAPLRAPASPGGPRACVQCGADLRPGTLQHHLALYPAEAAHGDPALPPRVWACGRCGHVELVVDWAAAMRPANGSEPGSADLLAEIPKHSVPQPALATETEDAPVLEAAAPALSAEEATPEPAPADALAEDIAPETALTDELLATEAEDVTEEIEAAAPVLSTEEATPEPALTDELLAVSAPADPRADEVVELGAAPANGVHAAAEGKPARSSTRAPRRTGEAAAPAKRRQSKTKRK